MIEAGTFLQQRPNILVHQLRFEVLLFDESLATHVGQEHQQGIISELVLAVGAQGGGVGIHFGAEVAQADERLGLAGVLEGDAGLARRLRCRSIRPRSAR